MIETPDENAVGVCCSGGGIRSAAFNLGALQALQEQSILGNAKYLAAVSGGSYIAAGFSMVAHRWSGKEQPGPSSQGTTTPTRASWMRTIRRSSRRPRSSTSATAAPTWPRPA